MPMAVTGCGDRRHGDHEDKRDLGRNLREHLRCVSRRCADLSGINLGSEPGGQALRAVVRFRPMNNFNPLIHSFPYLLRGAGMTVLMAATAVVPATIFGLVLALLQVFGNRVLRAAVVAYLFLIRGIPLLVLLTFAYYLLPLTGIDLPPF